MIGSVLIECIDNYRYDNSLPKIMDQLERLYSNQEISQGDIVKLHKELTSSSNGTHRELGFALEPLINFDPPSRDWRDLAIEMQDTEISLFDIFYRLEISKEQKYKSHDILEWLNSIGSSVNAMRKPDWIQTKTYLSKALEFSKAESIQKILDDEYLGGAMRIYQVATEKYYQEAIRYPVEVVYPEDHIDLLLELQHILLELTQTYELGKPGRVLADVILYPIEKVGVAISYLMDGKKKVETANYELGLACEHLKQKIPDLKDTPETTWANSIYTKLEIIFSKLPAEPWPVEGFGYPGVESRFKDNC